MDNQARALSALNVLDSGCAREEWVRISMAAKDAGVELAQFIEWSSHAANFVGERDCETTWNSVTKGGVTEATLYRLALDAGWNDPFKAYHNGHSNLQSLGRASKPIRSEKTPQTPNRKAANADVAEAWACCIPADPADAYIHRKHGIPDGVRVYPADAQELHINKQNVAGYLVVPCWNGDNLDTLQFIPQLNGGDKLNFPGASFGDGFFTVGDITDRVYVCEGIGQAWAVHTASGSAAVVCFGAGRMARVAAVLHEKYPSARLVIVPDRGKETVAANIARDVAGELCELPAEKPTNYDVNDYAAEHGADLLAILLKATHKVVSELPLLVVFADELPDTFTPPDEIVEGILTAGDCSMLFGDTNSGKTFLVIDMACAVARGVPWMGRQTEKGMVIYLAAESPSSVSSRLQAYQNHHKVRVPNFAIVQSPINLFDGDADTGSVIKLVHQLEEQRKQKAILIVGDTLARLSAGANESGGQDMGLVIRRADQIRNECKMHFLVIHHSGKIAAAGARGWSGVRAAIDTEIEITDSPAGRCAEITKQRDLGTKGQRIGFRLDSVTLGLTKWKALATSCIVASAEAPAKQTGKRISEVGGAVMEMLRSGGAGTKKAEVVKHFEGRYDSSSVYREMKKLVTAGHLREFHGVMSVVDKGADGAN